MDNIIVEIPCIGEWNEQKYISNSNCYLAEALKKLGHTDVRVSAWGFCRIGVTRYKPIEDFTAHTLIKAFETQSTVVVELKVSYHDGKYYS